MAYLTDTDLQLLSQQNKKINVRLLLLDSHFTIIDELSGALKSMSLEINAESDIRRSGSIDIFPEFDGYELTEHSALWIDRHLRIFLDYTYIPNNSTVSYCMGTFLVDSKSFSYNESSNSLSISLMDLMARLDGSHGGETGKEGVFIKTGTVIRDAVIAVVSRAGCTQYEIEPLGEYYHMTTQNKVPYDIELSGSTTLLDILTQLRNLYPGYETYFDPYGVFHCNMIPTCELDFPVLDEDTFYENVTILSEDRSCGYTGIYNVVQVYGKVYDDIDRYAEPGNSSFDGSAYNIRFDNFPEYKDYTYLAAKLPADNPAEMKININGLGLRNVYDSNDNFLPAGMLKKDNTCIFLYEKGVFRYLSAYQAIGLSVLVSETPPETSQDPSVKSVDYYKEHYRCSNISFITDKNNPFTVDKIGVLYKCLNGSEFDIIETESDALSTAKYYLWKYARLVNTISITCSIIPFLDVNQKFKYRHLKSGQTFTYITKQLSLEISETSAQMTITASVYNDLLPDIIPEDHYIEKDPDNSQNR